MIWGKWIDPNFEFLAHDGEGHRYEHFCYAGSEQELRARLKDKNLTVDWIRPYNFAEWKRRAKRATDKAIEAHTKRTAAKTLETREKRAAGKAIEANPKETKAINFRSDIWAELKFHLFEIFHGKCAYCEGKPQAVSFGDVEHYRPKAKVDEDPSHPGYYWLAYDETNLLPSCQLCNQIRGKMTHFPVVGAHARDPQSLAAEQPLLLNPYDRGIDPFQHLEFNEFGVVSALAASKHGADSKQFYHLNRPGLGEARREAMKKAQADWNSLKAIFVAQLEAARGNLSAEIDLGRREYSAAQKAELFRVWNAEKAAISGG